jgi:hypothetical protein
VHESTVRRWCLERQVVAHQLVENGPWHVLVTGGWPARTSATPEHVESESATSAAA